MDQFLHDMARIAREPYVLLIFMTALAFDFINGFHDAANSIATIVGTRVLRPMWAVCWAAWWNFVAAWFFGTEVANTVSKMVHPEFVTTDVIFAGLIGAIVWNLFTWFFGLPSSSSHALLGGFGGAAMAYASKVGNVLHQGNFIKTVSFIVVSPLTGLILALLMVTAVLWCLRKAVPAKVERHSRLVQLASSAAFSIGHGTNDAQKTMGIIAALLYAGIWKQGEGTFSKGEMPFWIVLACHLAIGLGTLAGGWRIVKTMGLRIAKLKPYSGACAEAAAAVALMVTAKLGIPVSTTHTITGAIIGVGAVQRFSAVRWGVARRVIWAWVMTIPMSALVAALSFYLLLAAGIAQRLPPKTEEATEPASAETTPEKTVAPEKTDASKKTDSPTKTSAVRGSLTPHAHIGLQSPRASREHLLHHLAGHVGQSMVASLVTEGEGFVIEPQGMEDRSLQVVYMDLVRDAVVTEFVGAAKLSSPNDQRLVEQAAIAP